MVILKTKAKFLVCLYHLGIDIDYSRKSLQNKQELIISM